MDEKKDLADGKFVVEMLEDLENFRGRRLARLCPLNFYGYPQPPF